MSIFNRTSLMESISEIDVEPYEGYIEPTMESVVEIGAELNENMYKLTTSLYVADLLLEQRAQAGEDVDILVEETIGEWAEATQSKLKVTLGKIKTFFINLINKIQDLISGGKRFIDKYEKGILKAANNKDAKWIEYDERYNAEEIVNCLNDIKPLISKIESLYDVKQKELSPYTGTNEAGTIESDILQKITPGMKTYDEAKEAITKKIKGKEINDKKKLDKADLTKMIDRVKKYTNGGKSETQKQAKEIIKLCSKIINNMARWKNGRPTDGIGLGRSYFIDNMKKIQKGVMFAFWVASHATAAYSNQYRQDISVLKSFVSANSSLVKGSSSESKDTKEDVQKESSDSLLENILEAF